MTQAPHTEIELPEPFCTLRLQSTGRPVDIAACAQDAEMWAYGTAEVFTADQVRAIVAEDRARGPAPAEALADLEKAATWLDGTWESADIKELRRLASVVRAMLATSPAPTQQPQSLTEKIREQQGDTSGEFTGMHVKASEWKELSPEGRAALMDMGKRAVDNIKADRVKDAEARAAFPVVALSAAPALKEPAEPGEGEFNSGDAELDGLLESTYWLAKGPECNNMDTALEWMDSLERIVSRLKAPAPKEPLTDDKARLLWANETDATIRSDGVEWCVEVPIPDMPDHEEIFGGDTLVEAIDAARAGRASTETAPPTPDEFPDGGVAQFVADQREIEETAPAPTPEPQRQLLERAISGIQYYISVKADTKFLYGAIDSIRSACAATPPASQPAPPQAWKTLYDAINNLMAHLGGHGEITPRHRLSSAVMEALEDIDGGTWKPEFASQPATVETLTDAEIDKPGENTP